MRAGRPLACLARPSQGRLACCELRRPHQAPEWSWFTLRQLLLFVVVVRGKREAVWRTRAADDARGAFGRGQRTKRHVSGPEGHARRARRRRARRLVRCSRLPRRDVFARAPLRAAPGVKNRGPAARSW